MNPRVLHVIGCLVVSYSWIDPIVFFFLFYPFGDIYQTHWIETHFFFEKISKDFIFSIHLQCSRADVSLLNSGLISCTSFCISSWMRDEKTNVCVCMLKIGVL